MTDNRWRAVGVLWALTGVLLLFGNAVIRLGARGIAAMRAGLEPMEWLALAVLTALFVYGEGVRALQRRYVPHLMRRVMQLRVESNAAYHLLAPLYALSLIGAPHKTLLYAWAGVAAIVLAVVVVSGFATPWRGITDFAVAAALAWGTGAILLSARRLFD